MIIIRVYIGSISPMTEYIHGDPVIDNWLENSSISLSPVGLTFIHPTIQGVVETVIVLEKGRALLF